MRELLGGYTLHRYPDNKTRLPAYTTNPST